MVFTTRLLCGPLPPMAVPSGSSPASPSTRTIASAVRSSVMRTRPAPNSVVEAAKSGEIIIPIIVIYGTKSGVKRIEPSAPAIDAYIEKQTDLLKYIDRLSTGVVK